MSINFYYETLRLIVHYFQFFERKYISCLYLTFFPKFIEISKSWKITIVIIITIKKKIKSFHHEKKTLREFTSTFHPKILSYYDMKEVFFLQHISSLHKYHSIQLHDDDYNDDDALHLLTMLQTISVKRRRQ